MRKTGFSPIALILVLSAGALFWTAEGYASPANSSARAEAPGQELLSGPLGGVAPSGVARSSSPAAAEALPDHDIYAEYGIKGLIERQYGRFQVRIFLAEYPAQAYGLYSFYRDPLSTATDFGTEGDLDVVEGLVQFWQGTHFAQVRDTQMAGGTSSASSEQLIQLARAVAERLSALDAKTSAPEEAEAAKQLPSVVRHLPPGSLRLRTARYILGPRALARNVGQDVSPYEFYPNFGTEAALASYDQGKEQMHLLIIEYHTPQQAGAAFARLSQYRDGLPAAEKAKRIIKRQGNYIVEASGFSEVSAAERTISAVKYDYVVKWLNDSTPGRNLASEAAKTAQLLVSVFGIIGLTLLIALITGTGVGLAKFYLRRRHEGQFEPFTDAGGMVRLNLDGIMLPDPRQNQKLLDGH